MKKYAIFLAVVVFFSIFAWALFAHAASTGPNYSATQVQSTDGSTFDSPWVNLSNLGANDATYATVALSTSIDHSYNASTTNYGFSVPAGSTINGIVVEITRKASTVTPAAVDNFVQLIKAGTPQGTNKANFVTPYTTSDVTASYGSSSDIWGLSFTSSDINASNFGVLYGVANTDIGLVTVSADSVRITVYYTIPGPHAQITQVSGTGTITSGTIILQ